MFYKYILLFSTIFYHFSLLCTEQKPQAGIIWRVSSGVGSGLYSVTSGALGYGVGGVKWAAGKSYEAGAAVVNHVKVPSIPLLTKKKDKKE